MCGIYGFWKNSPLTEHDIQHGRVAIQDLKHRGPDNQSDWYDTPTGIFLAHARLSILDLSDHSNQPMQRDGTVLTYNGEIYNYKEIANTLRTHGIEIATQGDTEVLLQAWRYWGDKCLDHFDGMFAFALYHQNTLHLCTDPFGEKPIYWIQTETGFYFASEPAPLVKQLDLKPEFSAEDIASFLCLGFLTAPNTGYHGLNRLPPGTHLTYIPETGIHTHQYWAPTPPHVASQNPTALSEQDLDTITDALIQSLSVRLRSDVPLGVFLSSGVDSALVAALSAKELNQNTQTFTVKFSSKEVVDESEAASEIAKHLNLPHKVIDSKTDPQNASPEHFFNLYGEANDNLTVLSAHQMSVAATEHLKVALSGLGGDEMFYGYNKYQMLYKWRRWLSLNRILRTTIASSVSSFFPRKWQQLTNLLSAPENCDFIAAKNTNICRTLWELPDVLTFAKRTFPSETAITVMCRHHDLTHTMPSTFIPSIERASMRASLEVRTPFLNRHLYETVQEFDPAAFLAFGQKSVLRRILARYLPTQLLERKKHGFNHPTGHFLNHFAQSPPTVPNLEPYFTNRIWSQRLNKDWQTLALRLVVLDHFANTTSGN